MSQVSYLNINQHLEEISEALLKKLNEDYSFYDIKLINFYVSTIKVPDEDTDRIKDVLNRKMEYGTLDYNWRDEQIVEISKRYASNPGSQENPGSMVAQIPIAMAFGEMLKNNLGDSFGNQLTGQGQAFGNSNNSQINEKIFCTNCGNELPSSSKFCNNCGHKVEEDLVCSKCGFKVNPDDNFCLNCGNKLK